MLTGEHRLTNLSASQARATPDGVSDWFRTAATRAAELLGKPSAFALAVAVIGVWGVGGLLVDFSDTWQLVINTGTTIVTFLMVFLVQNTQNRDSRSLHLKLDELIRATAGARTSMTDLSELSDEELARLEEAFRRLARFAARQAGPIGDRKDRQGDADAKDEGQ